MMTLDLLSSCREEKNCFNNSKQIIMKTNIYVNKLISIFFLLFLTSNVFSQEWEANDIGYYGRSIDFLNVNTGFVSVTTESNKYRILKTTSYPRQSLRSFIAGL
jgi:hypothetical protein